MKRKKRQSKKARPLPYFSYSTLVVASLLIFSGLYLILIAAPSQKAEWAADSRSVSGIQRALAMRPYDADIWRNYIAVLKKNGTNLSDIKEAQTIYVTLSDSTLLKNAHDLHVRHYGQAE